MTKNEQLGLPLEMAALTNTAISTIKHKNSRPIRNGCFDYQITTIFI